MKTSIAFFALSLLALHGAAHAHHGASHEAQPYGVFWMGALPKSGSSIGPGSTPDFWKKAFVSKYRTTGSAQLVPGF